MRQRVRSLLAAALLLLPVATIAAPVLDQQSPIGNASFNGGSTSITWQQSVTAGLTGLLNTIEIYIVGAGSGFLDFFVNRGGGWQADANDFQNASLAVTTGWNTIDITSANIVLSAGEQFMIGIHGLGSTFEPSFSGSSLNPYAGGSLYLSGSVFIEGEYDMAFRTFVGETTSVPEPGTLALLGFATAAAAFSRRRRQQSS